MLSVQYFKNLRITAKFILWFLFIALAPLAIAINISYSNSRKILEEEVKKNLIAVTDNKANQIETYLNEKEKNVVMLSSMSDMVDIIDKFSRAFDNGGIDSPEYISVLREYEPLLTYYQKSFGFDDLFLIRNTGDIIFSINEIKDHRSLYEIALYEDFKLSKLFIKTTESLKIEISDFIYYPKIKKAALYITAPVFNGSDFIGVIGFRLSNEGLSKLVQNYTGLGQTGETVIVSKIGDELNFVTPLRFDPVAAFRRKIDIKSQEGSVILKAFKGEKGLDIFHDYRGQEVSAIWRYLPEFRLGVIVKMDTSEIFSSAGRLRKQLFMVSLALLIVVVIIAIFIARSISRPIKELTLVSGVISNGDFSARAKINAKDEIGELAQSFNQMTDSLVEANTIVEQKKSELEEQKKLLEKANHELDSFVYTASHDLRAPLRGITAFASFLEEDYKDKFDEEGRDHLKEISEGARRMTELIDDLLTLSRISRIQNPYEEVDINLLINSAVKRIEFYIKEHKANLNIQQNLPIIKCDRIKMSEVFLNLINNGIKYASKNNKENPKVEIGYIEENEFHKFHIKDNGIGIDPKYHKQVFDIFRRLHTTKEYEGFGAGLSIVKRVIDDHGGEIWVESELGKGAIFYFTIPKNLKVKKKKIGAILVEDGLITQEELNEKLKRQEKG